MNVRLKDILERAQSWSEAAQEHAIELLLALEQEYAEPYELTDDDKTAIDRSLEQAKQGRFASDAEVQAVFGRARPK
jgi:hypothetical protein